MSITFKLMLTSRCLLTFCSLLFPSLCIPEWNIKLWNGIDKCDSIPRRDAKRMKKNDFKTRKNCFSTNNSMDLLGLVGLTYVFEIDVAIRFWILKMVQMRHIRNRYDWFLYELRPISQAFGPNSANIFFILVQKMAVDRIYK